MKIAERFQKSRVEGINYNPLILDEFQWDDEWVEMMSNNEVHPRDNLFWSHVDEATGASQSLQAPRVTKTYSRLRRGAGSIHEQVEAVEQNREERKMMKNLLLRPMTLTLRMIMAEHRLILIMMVLKLMRMRVASMT